MNKFDENHNGFSVYMDNLISVSNFISVFLIIRLIFHTGRIYVNRMPPVTKTDVKFVFDMKCHISSNLISVSCKGRLIRYIAYAGEFHLKVSVLLLYCLQQFYQVREFTVKPK